MVSLSSPQHFHQESEQYYEDEEDKQNNNKTRIFTYGLAYFYQLGNPGFKGEFSDSPISVVSPSFIKDHQHVNNDNNNNSAKNNNTKNNNMHWKSRLLSFYDKYNKSKLKEADELLAQYKGNESELFQALEEKYGPEFQLVSEDDKTNNKFIFKDNFVDIGCSSHGSFALTLSGDLYHWGYLYDDIYMKPSLIWDHVHYRSKASVINCGKKHAALITENGELYTWGCGLDGQLGHNSRSSRRQPTYVQGLKSQNIQCVGCGGGHTVVADDKGKLYAFGNNRNGQLGFAPSRDSKLTVKKPKLVKTDPIKRTFCMSVACGRQHTAIISDQGLIFTFGGGKYGRLGHGPSALREQNWDQGIAKSVIYKPRILKHGSLSRPLLGYQIACGDFHTVILDTGGTTYTCGKNDDGQCGHGTPHNYVSPRIVESLNGLETMMVAAGGNVSMALLADGSVYTWGDSGCGSLGFTIDHGQQGNNNTNSGVDPILDGKNAITLPCHLDNLPSFAVNIACSGGHTLVLAEDNKNEDEIYNHVDNRNYNVKNEQGIDSYLDRTSSRGNNSNASNDANTNNNNNNHNYKNRKKGNITSNARTVNIKQVESVRNTDNDSININININIEDASENFDVKYLFSRARHGHYDDISTALKNGFEIDTKDGQGNTLMLVAAQNGHKRITKLCLRHGADINIQNSISGNTALHFSFLYNHLSLFDYLLGKGADDNVLNEMDETCYDLETNNQ